MEFFGEKRCFEGKKGVLKLVRGKMMFEDVLEELKVFRRVLRGESFFYFRF